MRWLCDGRRVSESDYVVGGADPGVIAGLNVFETMRTYGGNIFRMEAHLERLRGSAVALRITLPDLETIRDELATAIEDLPRELGVRVLFTAGGRRLIQVTPLDLSQVSRPLNVATLVWEPPSWLDGRVKHGSRAVSEAARWSTGADEVFWVGYDGFMTEATRSSIFAVLDGVLLTPPDDGRILAGVTRAALMESARGLGIPVVERGLGPSEPFSELYASSTLKELSPVVSLDGRPAGGRGPIGEALEAAFRALVIRECGSPSHPR